MIDKERDAVKLLVLMNAVEYLGVGCPPNNNALELNFLLVMKDMGELLEKNDPRAICAGGIAGYYTDSLKFGTPAARARNDYPELYQELEKKIPLQWIHPEFPFSRSGLLSKRW